MEIDLARVLARRLGIPRVRFLNERLFSTLLNPGPKDWDIALAEISVTAPRATRVDFSTPYLSADQGVLVRLGLARNPNRRPAHPAALRRAHDDGKPARRQDDQAAS
jgi:ABC-type amino acid transport substrate-binding protein